MREPLNIWQHTIRSHNSTHFSRAKGPYWHLFRALQTLWVRVFVPRSDAQRSTYFSRTCFSCDDSWNAFFFFWTTYSIFKFHFLSGLVVTFVNIKSSNLAVEKPPLPDKAKQKDILQWYVELKVISLNEPPLQCNIFVCSENTSDRFLFIRLNPV